MKKLTSLIALCIACQLASAQIPQIKPLEGKNLEKAKAGLVPMEKKGKWGFADNEGKFVVKPVFDSATPFDKYWLSKVEVDGKFGLVGKAVQWIVEPVYESIGEFDDNKIALYVKDGKTGIIAINGKEVTGAVYDSIGEWSQYKTALFTKYGKTGVIAVNGKEVAPAKYDSVSEWDSHKTARFVSSGKTGIIAINGQEILPGEYDSVTEYNDEGYAFVVKDGKKGTVNMRGEIMLEPVYDEISVASESLYNVVKDGKKGQVDRKGKVWIDPVYTNMDKGQDGSFWIVSKDGKWGTITLDGKKITPVEFDAITLHDNGKFYTAQQGKLIGIMTTSGHISRDPDYDWVDSKVVAGTILIRQNGKYGAITDEGKYKFVAFYDKLEWAPSEDYLVMFDQASGKFGALSPEGKKIVGCDFDHAPDLKDSPVLYFVNGQYVFADKKSSITLKDLDEKLYREECAYDRAKYLASDKVPSSIKKFTQDELPGKEAAAQAKLTSLKFKTEWSQFQGWKIGGCGLYNPANGRWVLRPVCENPDDLFMSCGDWSVGTFSEGLAPVGFKGKYGYVNEDGVEVIARKYDSVSAFKNGVATVKLAGKEYTIDKTGKIK